MTEEKLEAIRERATSWDAHDCDDLTALLAEVDRLRGQRLDDAGLLAIEEREKAASAGPWVLQPCPDSPPGDSAVFTHDGYYIATRSVRGDPQSDVPNATFIAHSRADIPALLSHVRFQAGLIRDLVADSLRPSAIAAAREEGKASVDRVFVVWAHDETTNSRRQSYLLGIFRGEAAARACADDAVRRSVYTHTPEVLEIPLEALLAKEARAGTGKTGSPT